MPPAACGPRAYGTPHPNGAGPFHMVRPISHGEAHSHGEAPISRRGWLIWGPCSPYESEAPNSAGCRVVWGLEHVDLLHLRPLRAKWRERRACDRRIIRMRRGGPERVCDRRRNARSPQRSAANYRCFHREPMSSEEMGGTSIATARVPAADLGARTLIITFDSGGSFTSDDYSGQRSGAVTITLALQRERAGRRPFRRFPGAGAGTVSRRAEPAGTRRGARASRRGSGVRRSLGATAHSWGVAHGDGQLVNQPAIFLGAGDSGQPRRPADSPLPRRPGDGLRAPRVVRV